MRVERPATPPRVGGPTLPPLASAVVTPAVVATVQPIRPAPVAAPAPRPVLPPPHVAPPVRTLATPSAPRRTPACCWPIGEPGKKDFRFCDDASVPGKPYCDEHAKLAYVKIRDRKEDAA